MVTKTPEKKLTGRGGAGRGQGRKHGSVSAKTREAAERILNGQTNLSPGDLEIPDDATPLDVMIEAMRVAYRLGGALGAFPYAKEAAPYLHARINAITLSNPTGEGGQPKPFKYEVEFVPAKDGKPA